MTNDVIQIGLQTLRRNGLIVSLLSDDDQCIADGYDFQGKIVVSARAGTRKAALSSLLDRIRYVRPELLSDG